MKPPLSLSDFMGIVPSNLLGIHSGYASVIGGTANTITFPLGAFATIPQLTACYVLNAAGQDVGGITSINLSTLSATGFQITPFEDGTCYWTASVQA